jgi:peptidoglycan hydrolase CwlO-like protein
MEFGTKGYWQKELVQTKNRLDDINMHIDSLLEDAGELKAERDEIFKEYTEIKEELATLERKEEINLMEEKTREGMVYRALNTKSQTKLIEV